MLSSTVADPGARGSRTMLSNSAPCPPAAAALRAVNGGERK